MPENQNLPKLIDQNLLNIFKNNIFTKVAKKESLSFLNTNKINIKNTIDGNMLVSGATRVNLLNFNLLPSKTIAGNVTITNNNDGSFTITGNGTANYEEADQYSITDINEIRKIIGKPGNYTLFGNGNKTPHFYFNLSDASNKRLLYKSSLNSDTYTTFEITEEMINNTVKISFGIGIANGETISARTIYPMLNYGDTLLPFVPYEYDVKSVGKNIFKIDVGENTKKIDISSIINNDNKITMVASGNDAYNGYYTDIEGTNYSQLFGNLQYIHKNTKLYFKSMNGVFNKNFVQFWDINKKFINSHDEIHGLIYGFNNGYGEYNIPENAYYMTVRIGVRNSVVNATYEDDIMISFEPITSFEPYKESTVHIDNNTVFPLLGLKSYDSETNIIAPENANIEITYANNKSGADVLDLLKNGGGSSVVVTPEEFATDEDIDAIFDND